DVHHAGFRALGASIERKGEVFVAKADGRLHGGTVVLDYPSVMGTLNVMLAATLADGTTTIIHAACEPEVPALAVMLTSMGAEITPTDAGMRVTGSDGYHGVGAQAVPYPGLATDLHPPLAAFLTQAQGVSTIHERVFDNRMAYIGELRKMGADVITAGQTAI